jgi:hypothetical protein
MLKYISHKAIKQLSEVFSASNFFSLSLLDSEKEFFLTNDMVRLVVEKDTNLRKSQILQHFSLYKAKRWKLSAECYLSRLD